MHEMALCESILQILEEEARAQGFVRVTRVRLEVGPFAGVEPEALRFGFEAVTRGGLAEAAALEIIAAPGEAWCFSCGRTVIIGSRGSPCPACGDGPLQVTGGEQLRIKDLEVE